MVLLARRGTRTKYTPFSAAAEKRDDVHLRKGACFSRKRARARHRCRVRLKKKKNRPGGVSSAWRKAKFGRATRIKKVGVTLGREARGTEERGKGIRYASGGGGDFTLELPKELLY